MAKTKASVDLPVPAQAVWAVIGGFNALPSWHPAVAASELSEAAGGKVRTLSLKGGGSIEERLEQADDGARRYSYSIVASPLPVSDYLSTLSVKDTGSGCTVEWSGEFKPDGAPETAAVDTVRQIYEAGLGNLKAMFGG